MLEGGGGNLNDSIWFRRPCNLLRMPQQFHVKLQEPKALAESTQPFSTLAAKKAPLGQRQTSKTAWWWPVPFDELPFPFWSNPFPVWSNPLSLGMNTSVLPKVICKRHATFLSGYVFSIELYTTWFHEFWIFLIGQNWLVWKFVKVRWACWNFIRGSTYLIMKSKLKGEYVDHCYIKIPTFLASMRINASASMYCTICQSNQKLKFHEKKLYIQDLWKHLMSIIQFTKSKKYIHFWLPCG